MDKAARVRWTILLTVLGATVVAMFYPLDEAAAPAPTAVRIKASKSIALTPQAAPLRGVWEPLLADPFAPRRWDAPPPPAPAPVAVTAAPAVAEVVAAPPGPPPLPFQFVGQMNDSAQQVVYLARGEQALLARTGEVLEGTYKVLAITPLQIEFEHLPTGQKQALVFPPRNN
jgi:hypothetical protein